MLNEPSMTKAGQGLEHSGTFQSANGQGQVAGGLLSIGGGAAQAGGGVAVSGGSGGTLTIVSAPAIAIGVVRVLNGVAAVSAGATNAKEGADKTAQQAAMSTGASRTPKGTAADSAAPKKLETPATTVYKRPSGATTPAQRASVQGKPCVDCNQITPKQHADHKNPLVKQHYQTGSIDKKAMRTVDAVQPQCPQCSNEQGGRLSAYSKEMKKVVNEKQ